MSDLVEYPHGSAYLPIDGLDEQRLAHPGELKRLGEHPVVIRLWAGDSTVEIAAAAVHDGLLIGPYSEQRTVEDATTA